MWQNEPTCMFLDCRGTRCHNLTPHHHSIGRCHSQSTIRVRWKVLRSEQKHVQTHTDNSSPQFSGYWVETSAALHPLQPRSLKKRLNSSSMNFSSCNPINCIPHFNNSILTPYVAPFIFPRSLQLFVPLRLLLHTK